MVDFHHDLHLFLKIKKIGCSEGPQVCFPDRGIGSHTFRLHWQMFYYLYLKPSGSVYS